MKASITIKPKDIADLMTTAIESGYSNYWCGGVYLMTLNGSRVTSSLTNPWYADPRLYQGSSTFTIEIMEIEDESGATKHKKHHRNDRDMLKAFELMATKHSSHFGDFMSENYDAGTADVFLQLFALGEVIYG